MCSVFSLKAKVISALRIFLKLAGSLDEKTKLQQLKFFRKPPSRRNGQFRPNFGQKLSNLVSQYLLKGFFFFLNFCIIIKNKSQTKMLQLKFPKTSSIWGKCTIQANFGPTLCKFNIPRSTLRTFLKLCQSNWTQPRDQTRFRFMVFFRFSYSMENWYSNQ